MRRSFGFALVLLLAIGAPKELRAQESSDRALELAKQAIAISDSAGGNTQKLSQAIELFEQAFALDPRPQYQCSIGISYQQSGNLALAHLYLGRCIARTSDAERKSQLRSYHTALEDELRKQGFVPVDLTSRPNGADLSIPAMKGAASIRTPVQLWLTSGEHELSVSHQGYSSKQVVLSVQNIAVSRTIELSATEALFTAAKDRTDKESQPKTAETLSVATSVEASHKTRDSHAESNSKVLAWSAIGAGAIAAGGSAWFFTQALSARNTIRDDSPMETEYDSLHSDVRTREVVSYSLGVVAIASAAFGTYLLFSSDDTSQLDVALTDKGRGAMFSWSFHR